MPRGRLILYLTFAWVASAALSMLALSGALALGTMRMSPAPTPWRIAQMQLPPWLAAAALTPPLVLLVSRIVPSRWSWRLLLGAHVLLLVAFFTAHVLLQVGASELLSGQWGSRLTWRDLGGRATTGAVLIVAKYALIVGVIEAVRAAADARARAAERDRLVLQATGLERDLAIARLGALRQQLQPHFLFNALNAASALIDESPRAARELLARLADLLRLSLSRGDAPTVSLGDELDFVDRYLAVERARFGDRLRVTHDVDAAVLGARVPSFVLQPLVENAVRHGFASLPDGGAVEIAAREQDGRLEIVVRNDRQPGAVLIGEGIGLTQVRKRLEAVYGAGASLTTAAPMPAVFEARLRLPLRHAVPESR